jgi:hypothetical protein
VTGDQTPAGPESDAAALALRMSDLEQRIEEITQRVDNLVNQVARLSRLSQSADDNNLDLDSAADEDSVLAGEADDQAAELTAAHAPLTTEISPGMVRVIQLIGQGEGEAAQTKLHSLPEGELASQPAVVALVAAALFVQRGDYDSGLKAVSRARQLTNDERLIKLTQLIEQQATR